MRNDYAEFTGDTVLIPGRFSLLHAGHIKLIRTALKKFGKVQIGIRKTPINDKNPFTVEQRIKMIKIEFEKEIKKGIVSYIILADLKGIVRGRGVGWGIFDIELDKETESISATEIRKQNENKKSKS